MEAWPSTIPNPSLDYDIDPEDNTIKSPTTAGYKLTRPRFTRTRETFHPNWKALPGRKKPTDPKLAFDDLRDFFELVNCHTMFTWTEPQSGASKTVRFLEKPTYKKSGMPFHWVVSAVLEEV